jgi:probable F420-dependent oxidoreductase
LPGCVEVARLADAAGLYSIHFGEHLGMGGDSSAYPYGPFAHSLETPWLEPMTTLGAMAAVTQRIRLSTGVLLAPLRPALLLAKTVATLDVLSGGRVELGVGTGWQRSEYDAAGVAWSGRRARLYDTIAACRSLWGEQPASYSSPTVSFSGVTAYPRPSQDRVPILFGVAVTPVTAATIAEIGDGWCPVGVDLDGVRSGVGQLREAFARVGRDPAEIRVRFRLPDAVYDGSNFDFTPTFAPLDALRDAGATIFGLSIPPHLSTMDEMRHFLDTLARMAAEVDGPAHDTAARAAEADARAAGAVKH